MFSKKSNKPILHAECIYVQNPDLVIAHDVVHLHVETMSLLLKHVSLGTNILKLVCERLHAVLQHLVLQRHKTFTAFFTGLIFHLLTSVFALILPLQETLLLYTNF